MLHVMSNFRVYDWNMIHLQNYCNHNATLVSELGNYTNMHNKVERKFYNVNFESGANRKEIQN